MNIYGIDTPRDGVPVGGAAMNHRQRTRAFILVVTFATSYMVTTVMLDPCCEPAVHWPPQYVETDDG